MKSRSRLFTISLAAVCLAASLLGSAAQAASPAWVPIAGSGPTNLAPTQSEVQRLRVDAEGGTYTLSFGSQTTSQVAFNASASQVEAALNALSSVGGTGAAVTVSGGPGDKGGTQPYFIAFGGSFADVDVAQMSADSSGLTGGDNHLASVTTAVQGGPGTAEIGIYAQNVGGSPSSGTVELEFTLPPGVITSGPPTNPGAAVLWSCPGGAGETTMTCTSTEVTGPGFTMTPLVVPVKAQPGAGSGTVHIEVSGGGAGEVATFDMPLIVSAIPAPPGVQSWTAGTYDDSGKIDERAGAHPYSASTGILVNTVRSPRGLVVPAGEFRDIIVDTPPGFIGNPIATKQCPESVEHLDCPTESIVATSQVPLGHGAADQPAFSRGEFAAVNNIQAPRGYPAKFRFLTGDNQVLVNVVASLRSDEDYGLEVGSYNTPQIKPVIGAFFTIWGQPADASHDEQRCKDFNSNGVPEQCGPGGEDLAFLTNPVDCAEEALRPPVATINVNTWQAPTLLFAGDVQLRPVKHCEELKFEVEKFGFEPTGAKAADSPVAFRAELNLPTAGLLDPSPDARMNPTIRETVLDLPKGVVLNASAADVLAACSEEQIGLKATGQPRPNEIRFTREPNTCPDASKIGSGELRSALLEDPLQAELFLAAQGDGNPFGSLFAIYLVVEDPDRGIFIKLPGEVQLNGADGQQRIVFRDLPPLPFTSLDLSLKGGSRAPLATPTTCGGNTTTITNTPWSAPESGLPLTSPSSFAIDQGANGGPCAATPADRPFGLDLNAGTDSVTAGAFSPLTFQITRPDGAQEIDTLEVSLPEGLTASLKGIPFCPDGALAAAAASSGGDEQSSPACPSASQVGHTLVGAGSGPTPFYAPGKVYLAGPYKGAPLSVAVVTPAVAGPFDLGTVVVRSGIYVDPKTAQVTAKADPVPQILKGVPLRVRDIRVVLDRPGFALNPTDCTETAVQAKVTGNSGAVANLSERFQVGGCGDLGFKPRIRLSLKGGTKRGDNPALKAVVRPRSGDANIAAAAVRLPRSAFLDQSHIRTVCTRVQFKADACPKGAIYGRAEAVTPLLDEPLRGPVYLRSSDNKLPDLVADLRGPAHLPIRIEAAFRTDSVKGALRSTLDFAPDAPVTRFTLRMQGGRKGLVENSQDLCGRGNRATARFNGQNGRRHVVRPRVVATSCAKKRNGKSKRRSTH